MSGKVRNYTLFVTYWSKNRSTYSCARFQFWKIVRTEMHTNLCIYAVRALQFAVLYDSLKLDRFVKHLLQSFMNIDIYCIWTLYVQGVVNSCLTEFNQSILINIYLNLLVIC